MPARRKVSARQMELLVEFAESHRDIALGRFPGGPQAVRVTRGLWDSVANRLNSVAEGTTKTPEQWRRVEGYLLGDIFFSKYWIEFKAKTKAKAADSRRNSSATGGGPNKLVPLNEIEGRVLAIVGQVAVEGLPGVRLPIQILPSVDVAPADSGIADPLWSYPSTSITAIPQSLTPNLTSPEPLMEVEWLEEEILSPLVARPESQASTVPPPSTESQPADVQLEDNQPETSTRADRPQRSTLPARRSSLQRPNRRDARVPRWAYDMEMRRVAAEERHATALEALARVELMREIRNDVHSYIHRT